MTKPKSSRVEGTLVTLAVAVVAPVWFQEPLAVLLHAAPGTRLWAYGSSNEELLSLPMQEAPDLVLLYGSDMHPAGQVKQVKAGWPTAQCVALIRDRQQESDVIEAGADVVLLQGIAPGQLLAAIDGLREEFMKAHDSVGLPAEG